MKLGPRDKMRRSGESSSPYIRASNVRFFNGRAGAFKEIASATRSIPPPRPKKIYRMSSYEFTYFFQYLVIFIIAWFKLLDNSFCIEGE